MSAGETIFNWVKGQFEIRLIFQVVDDPDDHSDYFNYLKPVDVWYIASLDDTHDLDAISLKDFTTQGSLTTNITKTTDRDLRTGLIRTDKSGAWLYVLAQPTKEWQAHYQERRYKIKVETAKQYNIAVSIRPTNSGAGSNQADDKAAKSGRFKL